MEGDAGTSRLTPLDDDINDADTPEADTSEADTTEAAQPAQRSLLYSRGWAVAATGTLVVLAAVIAGAGFLTMRTNQQTADRQAAEAAAVQAAKDCVIATHAPDLEAMIESQQKIIECATGDFGAQANLYSGILVDAYQMADAKVQVPTIRAAVERTNDDGTIDVLVALRTVVSNSTVADHESGYRLRVRMAEDNGRYKIAELDQVAK